MVYSAFEAVVMVWSEGVHDRIGAVRQVDGVSGPDVETSGPRPTTSKGSGT